ncbi:FAD-binding domain-containing protein [Marasmius fiardii PR-910]|nr:FAD-binding domain-containing protein [Marasmius fiardii PR-910]
MNYALQRTPSYAKDTDRILYNWSGLQYIAPKNKVYHPRDEAEIAEILCKSRKVRVIGTALSYEPISSISQPPPHHHKEFIHDDTTIISLQHEFIGLISLNKRKTTATFHAATTIDDVIRILAQHGLMMTVCPGVIGIQTLAGSISTGTHGQGLFQSDYADMVQSFRIILADGNARTMTPTDPNFHLYLISMGLFGIITQIEVAVRPRVLFTCTKFSAPYKEFLKNYVKWNEVSEFCKVWWFPKTDLCQVWLVNPSSVEEVKYYEQHKISPPKSSKHHHHQDSEPVGYPMANEEQNQMNQTIKDYIHTMANDTKVSETSGEPQFRTLTRFMNMTNVIGWVEQLLTKGIAVPQINCEISVPIAQFQDATKALHDWNSQHPGTLHYPFIYRVTGSSKALMSASHRGPVVWIGFLVYISQSGDIRDDGMTTMYQLQQTLAPFDALPHWGKHFHPHLFHMQRNISPPIWQRFTQELAHRDPARKLISPFLHKIFYEHGTADQKHKQIKALL